MHLLTKHMLRNIRCATCHTLCIYSVLALCTCAIDCSSHRRVYVSMVLALHNTIETVFGSVCDVVMLTA